MIRVVIVILNNLQLIARNLRSVYDIEGSPK